MNTKKKLAQLEAFKAITKGYLGYNGDNEVFEAIEKASELLLNGKVKHLELHSTHPKIGVMGCMGANSLEMIGHELRVNNLQTIFMKVKRKNCRNCRAVEESEKVVSKAEIVPSN